jgi:hypothetical protein
MEKVVLLCVLVVKKAQAKYILYYLSAEKSREVVGSHTSCGVGVRSSTRLQTLFITFMGLFEVWVFFFLLLIESSTIIDHFQGFVSGSCMSLNN